MTTKKKKLLTPNGQPLVGSTGPLILKDLGITDVELAAFLPVDAPRWVRGVFWCQFEGPESLDAIAAHFEDRYTVKHVAGKKFPPGGPPDGVDLPMIIVQPKGKYASYMFYGMRGDLYVEDGSWQLEAAFRESGRDWGSNRAVYERFKALELTKLGVRNITERTE